MDAFDRFPRVVKHIEELQEIEQQALRAAAPQAEFEIIVFFPPLGGSLGRRPIRQRGAAKEDKPRPQIWACQARQLFVLQHIPQSIRVERVALDDILTFELGEILLYAWIELRFDDGTETRTAYVAFNSVGLQWIEPLIETLRGQTTHPTPNTSARLTPRIQSPVTHLTYKWETILRDQANASGETVTPLAYEPSVAPRFFWRGGREGHLLILTPTRIIKITEPLHSYPYGKVATWCSRSRVREVRFDVTEKGARLELALGAHDALFQIEMSHSHIQELRALVDELRQEQRNDSGSWIPQHPSLR